MLCENGTRDFVQGHCKQVPVDYLASLCIPNTDGIGVDNGIRLGGKPIRSNRVHLKLKS